MRLSSLALLVLCLSVSPTRALGQSTQPAPRPLVTLAAEPLFSSEGLSESGTVALRVTVTNHTGRDLSGELLVQAEGWRDRSVPQRVRVDLPARQQRDLRLSLQVSLGTERCVLTYTPEGIPPQRAQAPLSVRTGTGVVVLANPPRMRGHLFAMGSGASGYPSDLLLAEASFAPESGDPRVPDDAAGWSAHPIVFATVADAEKLEGAARRALVGHVQAGARLVLVPRRPEDCTAPIVRELLGPVTCNAAFPGEASAPPSTSWQRARRFHAVADASTQIEPFGLSRPLGFGTTFLLDWDANAADAPPDATQELLQALLLHLARPMRVHHPLGGLPEDPSSLRTALDPNESFRPALGIVAILLLFYVLAVGPLNFRYVERQGRPTVALLTTPLIALVCLVLMAGAAYFSKGVRMRTRVIDLLEIPSGDTRGVRTRYVSYYLTRPRTFDAVPEAGVARLLEQDAGGRGVAAEVRDGGVALTGLRGGLWETIVTQEQSLVDTGGALRVDIRAENVTQVRVTNTGSAPLMGAVYINGAGEVYVLGDLAPGESRLQPTALLAMLPDWELRMSRGDTPEVESTTLAMGMPVEAALGLRAAMSVIRVDASREGVWARIDGAGEGASADDFTLEWERRFVFIAARREASAPIHSTPPVPQAEAPVVEPPASFAPPIPSAPVTPPSVSPPPTTPPAAGQVTP